jgi:hypothetical protein
VPELKAKFTADDSQFSSKLKSAQTQLGGLKSVFGGIIGGLGVHQLVQFASNVANVASELADASDALGIATSDLQALQVLSVKAGFSLEKLEAVLNRIGTARLDAISDPTGEAAKKFAALGISVKQLSSMSVVQSIAALGKQMGILADNEGAMSAAKDIIGARSPRAVGVIRDYGAMGSQAARDAAAGYMMEEKAIKSLDGALDKLALDKMKYKSMAGNAASFLFENIGTEAMSLGKMFDRINADKVALNAGKSPKGNDISRIKDFISNPDPSGSSRASMGASIKEAMDRQIKAASSMNSIDPFAAVGRAAGRDSVSDTLGTLRKIEENTRRIQPTPAPLMR